MHHGAFSGSSDHIGFQALTTAASQVPTRPRVSRAGVGRREQSTPNHTFPTAYWEATQPRNVRSISAMVRTALRWRAVAPAIAPGRLCLLAQTKAPSAQPSPC